MRPLCLVSAVAASLGVASAITAPNTSLATTPTGYFGGNAAHRGEASIAMLAKSRIVMLEKWESPCWQGCLADPNSPSCLSSCAVESNIIATHKRIKAVNPSVSSVMYLNTLLDFSFYTLHGVFEAAHALTIDSVTKKPVEVRNDNGMEGIFIFGFDTEIGVELYIQAIKNYTSTGVIDGFFGDKWGSAAEPVDGDPTSADWKICNHECGNITRTQGVAWNAGKAKALAAATEIVGAGPYFANGDFFEGVESNLNGAWATAPLFKGDPRPGIADVKKHLKGFGGNHTYTYVAACGDQHWTTDPNAPETLQATCVGSCHARFLLAVEEGAFLGSNGWDKSYDYPLGDPTGPAEYTAASVDDAGVIRPATLSRNFSTGTYVVFTYNAKGDDGEGVIYWLGQPPAPPAPPGPPLPPPTPGPPIQCGGVTSSVYNDTTFSQDDVAASSATTAAACCADCAKASACVEWAFHTKAAAKQPDTCHLHGPKSVLKSEVGCVAGVMSHVL